MTGLVAGTDWNPEMLINSLLEDLVSGRMVDVIDSGEPAVMVCHWPGIYFNGERIGFNILKQVKKRLDQKYDNLIWMKLSEIASYWAAKNLTSITVRNNIITLNSPYASPGFTLKLNSPVSKPVFKAGNNEVRPFEMIKTTKDLKSNTWYSSRGNSYICFNLEKGLNELTI